MRVYLYGKRGGRGNFKITTAEVYSTLDYLIEEALISLTNHAIDDNDYYVKDLIEYLTSWSIPTIYWTDVDSNLPARKVGKKMWEEAVKDFSDRNIDKIAKYELLRKS